VPTIDSPFRPPFFLRNPHVQTILPVLLPYRCRIAFQRERIELEDGDFLDLDWAKKGNRRLAILSHGLEGSSDANYIHGTAGKLLAAGWDVLAWNFRGCGQEPNRLARFYHSGETRDLDAVVRKAAETYDQIALVGFSLGGNVTLKYLGEGLAPKSVVAGVAISSPVDLTSSAKAIDGRRSNWLYLNRFIQSLIAKIEKKAVRFPRELDATGVRGIRTLYEFDNRYTAPLHGFKDAADYWARASSLPYLSRISVPSLLLSACDDPFLTPESIPFAVAKASECFFLEAPAKGGHVGFLDLHRGVEPYFERRIVEFLGSALRAA